MAVAAKLIVPNSRVPFLFIKPFFRDIHDYFGKILIGDIALSVFIYKRFIALSDQILTGVGSFIIEYFRRAAHSPEHIL